MISSVPLSVLFTVAYAATGCYALLRWASLRAGRAAHPGDQVAELSHLAMSLAMIGMTWGYGGSIANQVQIVAFTAFAGYFATRLRAVHRAAQHCPGAGFHLLMAVAMVWMVASMPLLMGMPVAGSGSGGHSHDGHGASAATPDAAPTPAPAWALVVTFALVAALLVATVYWARRAALAPAPSRAAALVPSGAPAGSTTSPAPVTWLTPRSDALCHLVMSLGMAAMFAAMV